MDNNDNSNLALEEIIATGAVFLLAGWFLWHHFSNQDDTIQFVPTVSQADHTSIWEIDENQQKSSRKYTAKSAVTTPESPGYSVTIPSQAIQTNSLANRNRQYDLDMTGLYSQDSVRPTNTHQIPTDQLTSKSKQLVKRSSVSNSLQNTRQQSAITIPDNKTQQAVVALSQRTDMEQPGQANVTPTIQQPISTDSTGALKLKGNATPDSHILLLLNGRKVTSVQVTPTGQWSYETYLIPGEYSVQVKDDQNLKQSKSYQIVISKPQIQWSNPVSKPQPAPAPVIPNTEKRQIRSRKNRLYRVKPGDTLYTLSKRYAVTVNEITRANQISDKDQISVGQILKIPKRPSN